MAKILEMSTPPQTATKTQVKVSTAAGIGAAVLTVAALMSFFSVSAATSIWNLGQIKSDFGYESHILFGNDDYYPSAGEYGTVYNLTHEWKTVKFLRDYGTEAPVVIAQPLSFKGGQPSHIRIKNVTPTSFDLKIEEWGYMDGAHVKEDVSFIVWPQHISLSLDNGFLIDSGFVDANQEWTDIPLSSLFKERLNGATPIIFTQSQTFNGGDPIVTRNKTVNNIPEFIPPDPYAPFYGEVVKSASMPEGLYYVGYNSNTQKYARYYFPYLDPRPTRPLYQDNEYLSWYMDKNNVLTISDTEMAGYPIAGNVTFRPGTKLIKLDNNLKIWAVEPGGILRELKINYNVLYGRDFINRVQVIPDAFFVNYTAGKEWTDQTKHPDGTLIQYTSSSDIYLISNGQKRKFTGDSFAVNRYKDEYIVKNVDPNIFVYGNGNDILGGEKELLNIAGQIPPVSPCKDSDGGKDAYTAGSADNRVNGIGSYYLDKCQASNGGQCTGADCVAVSEAYCNNDQVTNTLIQCLNSCSQGACVPDKTYQTRLQEEEAKGAHVIEKVGYIAIKPFSGIFTFGNQKIEVGSIGNATHNWTLIPFRQNFENAPAFLAHTQTFNGGDTAGLRYKELDNLKAYVKVEEERSKDTEINHIAETVGYIAISRPMPIVGSLNVELAGDPNPQEVIAGTEDFTFVNLIFDATDSTSDLQVSQVKVTISTGNGGFPANLSNSTLWDGAIQLMPANDPDAELSANTTPGGAANAIFTLSSPLSIPAGASKTLTYKANISAATASGAEISAGIQPGAEPTVQDAGENEVVPVISYSAGPKMTILEASGNPVAYYKFEDNTLDSSGNGANATAFGPIFTPGQVNRAIQFDGVDDYLALPLNYQGGVDQISELTACAWFYTESRSNDVFGNWSLVDFDRSEYFNFFINEKTGQLGFATHSKSPALIHDLYSERRYLYDAFWHFGCAIYDYGQKYFYLDGELDYGQGNTAVQTFHSGAPLASALTRFGFIGDGSKAASFNGADETEADPNNTGRSNSYYSGRLDELRIYEKILTEAEMKNLYLAGFGLYCDPKYQALGIDPENLTYEQKQLLAAFPEIDTLTADDISVLESYGLNLNILSICDKIYVMQQEAESFFATFIGQIINK